VYCDEHAIALWPHTKTHKSIQIAQLQLDAGACGLTAAKLTEAEVMLGSAVERILIAYPIVGAEKARRVAELAGRCDVSVALDSVAIAEGLSDAARDRGTTVGVLVELDVGLRRVGIQTVDALVALAQRVDRMPGLELQGIACYPGHLRDPEELDEGLAGVEARLKAAVGRLNGHGLRADRVSAGSSPTAFVTHQMPTVTESRAGTYVLGDLSDPAPDSFALTVLARIVSTSVPGRAVIDAGSKTLSSDRALDPEHAPYYGHVADDDGSPVVELFEEHGLIDVTGRSKPLAVGDLVRIVPNHCCAVMNLHDEVVVVDGDDVIETWQVSARGRAQ
jgi:D-serine deaminase-like pyridoxal phosphate-dependent protein